MEKIDGLEESFIEAKVVLLTTYSSSDEKTVRPMLNMNVNPYKVMSFTSYKKSRKVEEILKNNTVSITFPSKFEGKKFEITGKAEFERDESVQDKWVFWYSEMHPWSQNLFWFPRYLHHSNWTIIDVHPVSAKLIN